MENIKQGIVISIISNLFFVEIENKIYECNSRGIFKNKEEKPIVGDIVKVCIQEKQNTIIEIINRKIFLKRPKIANLTQLLLVISAKNPKPDLLMLDKQLAIAEYLKINPIIIINKKDLDEKETNKIAQIYSKIGYRVIKSNAKNIEENINEIKSVLHNNINVFSGNSGVGKSTLINRILNNNVTQEGEISYKNKKGKNTTTWVKLYKLEENTYIADTPGFSTFDIYEINYKELFKYFVEFEKYIKKCEFSDCTHIKEEACGVKLEVGKNISESRYNNFKKIYIELKDREEHKW